MPNIDELFDKYADEESKGRDYLMNREQFTQAIAEIISIPLDAQVMGFGGDNNLTDRLIRLSHLATILSAVDLSIKTFKSYGYGSCIFNHAELMASEGQYSKPDILLITA